MRAQHKHASPPLSLVKAGKDTLSCCSTAFAAVYECAITLTQAPERWKPFQNCRVYHFQVYLIRYSQKLQ